ncbi:MFS transporter, partial [Klebsiella pneumoniae]|uniref:MFS transporter n=1 Tax=Klebsiella pneumoniae TaxID=573 RepID=UPI0021091431
ASDIGASFQVSASSVGVAIAGQLLPLAFAGLIMGWLIDRLGPKPLLLIGLIALGGASLANAWVGDFNVLRGTLLVQGVALVALLTSGQGLLMMCTTGRKQVQSLTLWSTVMPVGYALGLLMVSPFAGSATWQHVFFVHAA